MIRPAASCGVMIVPVQHIKPEALCLTIMPWASGPNESQAQETENAGPQIQSEYPAGKAIPKLPRKKSFGEDLNPEPQGLR